ncbi:hypothetical protein HNR46_003158 [Haloferula luteola]|uniref:Lipoprotein n=1 Tax=Haloferula luteola TaxID=595692 RepID=A0A840VGG0_9BACT|nr:hypothetical protein [Haloferula luteola]MBB5352909.1 hypothetical protein [Haloferula luteola]
MKLAQLLIVPGLALGLSSCGVTSDRRGELHSVPAAKSVTLTQDVSWGDGFWKKKFTFPAGQYHARYESPKGYFYEYPDSLQVFDSGMRYGKRGGLYLKKGESAPTRCYIDAYFDGAAILDPGEPLPVR